MRIISLAGLLASLLLAPCRPVSAAQFSLVHEFMYSIDGAYPSGRLVMDSNGALYGTTYMGGTSGYGTVFKLTPPASAQSGWTETTLYGFRGGKDGANPGGLLIDATGALYGAAADGPPISGTPCASGCGIIFKLAPPAAGQTAWTKTDLHDFDYTDGYGPGLSFFGPDGVLYGLTYSGGNSFYGTVFALSPPASGQATWSLATLYSFDSLADGYSPTSLVMDADGTVYGASGGGAYAPGCYDGLSPCGLIYSLKQPASGAVPWVKTTLYRFTNSDDGYDPVSLILDGKGGFYGTLMYGGVSGGKCINPSCGTVYKLSPPDQTHAGWSEQVLHRFAGSPDGAQPFSLGQIGGVLYGVTAVGGSHANGHSFQGCGTIFTLTPPAQGGSDWAENTTSCGDGRFGVTPDGPLLLAPDGVIFGTAQTGGPGKHGSLGSSGTVFSIRLSPERLAQAPRRTGH